MEADHANAAGAELAAVQDIVAATFVNANYVDVGVNNQPIFVTNVYSSRGMVWAVQILHSFEEFIHLWGRSTETEAKLVATLTQVATVEQRWNLSLLVIVLEVLREELIDDISRFQEEPSSFARFVITLEFDDPLSQLKSRLEALLLQWMEDSGPEVQAASTVEEDINKVVETTAAEYGLGPLRTLGDSLRSPNPNDERVLNSLLSDLRKQIKHETQ